jgi:hypothetical protein
MELGLFSRRAISAAALSVLFATATRAADSPDISAEINALKARIADLEAQQNETWLTKERESQIRGIVEDVLKDAKSRGQFADGVETGYTPGSGFYIQTPDKNFKLSIGGFVQVRYEYGQYNAYNDRTLPGRPVGGGTGATTVTPSDPGNSSGLSIRRARVTFAGNAFTPDLTFKLEGDFYGGNYVNSINVQNQSNASTGPLPIASTSSGAFTLTDAFIAYRLSDQIRFRVGSFKAPFAKAELTSDTQLGFVERSEILAPFNPSRVMGFSVFGDLIKDKLAYEVNINNGSRSNLNRAPSTVGGLANLDNRMAYYARVQYAGAGKLADFADEGDMRADNRELAWLVGAGAGYESQNATNTSFPAPQNGASSGGLSNGTNGGFQNAYVLNGNVYRGTVDFSAKYQGLSINTAAYVQQFNHTPGNTSSTSGTSINNGPFGANNTSFFQYGAYGQVGYFVIPYSNGKGLELLARAGVLGTEGYNDMGEYYTIGANYYMWGHNFKVSGDVTYTPEAAYTDSSAALLQNTHDVIFRVQVQLRF